MENDKRNVTDEFRGMSVDDIKSALDKKRQPLEIAIENLERDFNMGTIVRSANAFNVRKIHIIGKRQWNRRGAMVTDRYMNVIHHKTVEDFINATKGLNIIGVDNIVGSKPLFKTALPANAVLVFGSEQSGLSEAMIDACDRIVEIEQFGSTRSINVGVAAGIAMYVWLQQHAL